METENRQGTLSMWGILADFIVNSIAKKPKSKIFNLANGKKVSVNQIFRELKGISGFEGQAKRIKAVKGEVRDIVLDTRLAKRELGWSPKTSLTDGLAQTYEYFSQNYHSRR